MNDIINKDVEYWLKNLKILQDELEKSTSDRSCVIVAAAYIDELLGYIFKLFMTSPSCEKEDKDLFSGYGPLSNFSSKIVLSYRLGLISNYEYKTLQIIRKIRNSFAHDITKDSLLEFKDRLMPFVPTRQLLLIKSIPIPSENGTEPPLPKVPEVDMSSARDIFVKTVLCLTNLLSSRFLDAAEQHREVPSDYKSLLEIDDKKICLQQKNLDKQEHIMNLINESIDLHQQIISKLSNSPDANNTKEIEKHKAEIEKLELKLTDERQDYIRAEALLSMTKYAREQIKKAYDKERLTYGHE